MDERFPTLIPRYNTSMLRIIFYTIIAVLILSFFGISLQGIVHSPASQANFDYVWSLVVAGFNYVVNFFAGIVGWFKAAIAGTFD